MMYDYSQEKPQYSDKKVMALKVTNRDFIRMPVPEIVPPTGYRNTIPPQTTSLKSAIKSQTTVKDVKHKTSKQVSEFGDRDVKRIGKSAKAD